MENSTVGRIVAVNTNGRLKYTYNGNPDLKVFAPSGIAITPSENIILSDENNNALHVLNYKGELLGLNLLIKNIILNDQFCCV